MTTTSRLRVANFAVTREPDKTTVDLIKRQKELLTAQDELLKIQSGLIKDGTPMLGENFGKKGALTVESGERDKLHVTAKSAQAFSEVADALVAKVMSAMPPPTKTASAGPASVSPPVANSPVAATALVKRLMPRIRTGLTTARGGSASILPAASTPALALTPAIPRTITPVVLLTEADRQAFLDYIAEERALDNLEARIQQFLGIQGPIQPSAVGMTVFAVGTALAQLAQLTQIFRSDKSLAFTDSLLPDELLLDLVAVKLASVEAAVRYPVVEIDGLMSEKFTSSYVMRVKRILGHHETLVKAGEAAKAILEELKTFAARLATSDSTTKIPVLITVLRGELVAKHANEKGARVLTIKVVSKGGASLKVSSVWRSERLYASGGLIVTYRLVAVTDGKLLDAGVVSRDSSFERIPLD